MAISNSTIRPASFSLRPHGSQESGRRKEAPHGHRSRSPVSRPPNPFSAGTLLYSLVVEANDPVPGDRPEVLPPAVELPPTSDGLSEEEFVAVVEAEWDRLVSQVVSRMYRRRAFEGRAINRSDAEDIVQVALIAAWEQRHTYRKIGPVGAWLWGFVRYAHLSHATKARQTRKHQPFFWTETESRQAMMEPFVVDRTQEEILESEAEKETYRGLAGRLIALLPEPLQETLNLHYEQGATPAEISREHGVDWNTVDRRLAAGRRAIIASVRPPDRCREKTAS